MPSISTQPTPINQHPELGPAVALAGAAGADDRQHDGDQAHVRVHLVIGIEAVHPVGVAGAGAVGFANDQGRQQLGVPRAERQISSRSGPPARGDRSSSSLEGTHCTAESRTPRPTSAAAMPMAAQARCASPRSVAAR